MTLPTYSTTGKTNKSKKKRKKAAPVCSETGAALLFPAAKVACIVGQRNDAVGTKEQ